MVSLLSKTSGHGRCIITSIPIHEQHFLQNFPFLKSSTRFLSIEPKQHSSTLDYLITKCGLSPESASSVSKKVNFLTLDKPDSVIALFNTHGFSKTHTAKILKGFPRVLLSNPEKTLLPKIDFLASKGFSSSEVTLILSSAPAILRRSLDNHIIPSYNFLNDTFKSEEQIVSSIKRYPGLLTKDLEAHLAPNLMVLRENGVPDGNIRTLLAYHPRSIVTYPDVFKDRVEEVKEMGFNPTKMKFLLAVHALRSMSKEIWDMKFEVYKKWGLSKDDVLKAFGRNPWCLVASEKKITGILDFLVVQMGLEASLIVNRPSIMTLSLERRIMPRCFVGKALISKGLVKKGLSWTQLLESTEKVFLWKYVDRYAEEAPMLLKLYEDKLNQIS